MSARSKFISCIAAGIYLELIAAGLAVGKTYSPCGHAELPRWFCFVFPYLMMIPKSVSEGGSVVTSISHATLFQMPIYGVIVGIGWGETGHFWRFALPVLAVHCICGIIGFIIQSS